MKAWKEKQLLRYGTIVPVVRCGMHGHFLSVTFAGQKQVDGNQAWETAAEATLTLKSAAATNAVPVQ